MAEVLSGRGQRGQNHDASLRTAGTSAAGASSAGGASSGFGPRPTLSAQPSNAQMAVGLRRPLRVALAPTGMTQGALDNHPASLPPLSPSSQPSGALHRNISGGSTRIGVHSTGTAPDSPARARGNSGSTVPGHGALSTGSTLLSRQGASAAGGAGSGAVHLSEQLRPSHQVPPRGGPSGSALGLRPRLVGGVISGGAGSASASGSGGGGSSNTGVSRPAGRLVRGSAAAAGAAAAANRSGGKVVGGRQPRQLARRGGPVAGPGSAAARAAEARAAAAAAAAAAGAASDGDVGPRLAHGQFYDAESNSVTARLITGSGLEPTGTSSRPPNPVYTRQHSAGADGTAGSAARGSPQGLAGVSAYERSTGAALVGLGGQRSGSPPAAPAAETSGTGLGRPPSARSNTGVLYQWHQQPPHNQHQPQQPQPPQQPTQTPPQPEPLSQGGQATVPPRPSQQPEALASLGYGPLSMFGPLAAMPLHPISGSGGTAARQQSSSPAGQDPPRAAAPPSSMSYGTTTARSAAREVSETDTSSFRTTTTTAASASASAAAEVSSSESASLRSLAAAAVAIPSSTVRRSGSGRASADVVPPAGALSSPPSTSSIAERSRYAPAADLVASSAPTGAGETESGSTAAVRLGTPPSAPLATVISTATAAASSAPRYGLGPPSGRVAGRGIAGGGSAAAAAATTAATTSRIQRAAATSAGIRAKVAGGDRGTLLRGPTVATLGSDLVETQAGADGAGTGAGAGAGAGGGFASRRANSMGSNLVAGRVPGAPPRGGAASVVASRAGRAAGPGPSGSGGYGEQRQAGSVRDPSPSGSSRGAEETGETGGGGQRRRSSVGPSDTDAGPGAVTGLRGMGRQRESGGDGGAAGAHGDTGSDGLMPYGGGGPGRGGAGAGGRAGGGPPRGTSRAAAAAAVTRLMYDTHMYGSDGSVDDDEDGGSGGVGVRHGAVRPPQRLFRVQVNQQAAEATTFGPTRPVGLTARQQQHLPPPQPARSRRRGSDDDGVIGGALNFGGGGGAGAGGGAGGGGGFQERFLADLRRRDAERAALMQVLLGGGEEELLRQAEEEQLALALMLSLQEARVAGSSTSAASAAPPAVPPTGPAGPLLAPRTLTLRVGSDGRLLGVELGLAPGVGLGVGLAPEPSLSYEELLNLEDVKVTTPQEVLDALPVSTYDGAACAPDGACAICQSDYERGDQLVRLPCNHVLHNACARQWLGSYSKKCPVCKSSVCG